jgi:WD40 repeat protein
MRSAWLLALFLSPDVGLPGRGFRPERLRLDAEFSGMELQVYSVAISPDGRLVAAGGDEGVLRIWDRSTRLQTRTLETGGQMIRRVAYSSDGAHVLVGTADGMLHVFKASTGDPVRTFPALGYLQSFDLSPDGKQVAALTLRTCRIYDLADGKEARALTGHFSHIDAVVYSRDGKRLATAGREDAVIKIWDASTGVELQALSAKSDPPHALALRPDGQALVAAYASGLVRVWDLAKGAEVATLGELGGKTYGLAWSSDGRFIVAGGKDGTLRISEAFSGREVRRIDAHKGKVRCVTFTPSGRYLLTAGEDGRVCLYAGF